jgi:23S rRNA (uracil1939-C5)-methyltransferase
VTEVRIREIAAGGDGVGRLDDGIAVFVPRTAPDDLVEIELVARKPRYARARVVRIAAPSPRRVAPTCTHYERDACGGCQLQHLAPEAQLDAKRAIVREALRRIGGIPLEDVEIVPAAQAWRYRTTVALAIDDSGRIGLHPWDRPDAVFPLDDCLITRAPLMRLWQATRSHAGLLPAHATHLVMREDRTGDAHLIVRGGNPPWHAAALARALGDAAIAIWWEPQGGGARVVAGSQTGFPATAFAQVQPDLADRIRRDAVAALGDVAELPLWDLYGGTGDGARLLAARGARVWSVDANRSAVEWAARQPVPPGAPDGSPTYLEGRVEEVLHRLPEPGAVLLNPPRTGVGARVAAALNDLGLAGRTRRVAYVSCDPATLARDLARMPAFRVAAVRAYDLFPQTAHVETLAALEAA